MIQRIQSLLLFGVVVLLLSSLFLPVWTNTEMAAKIEVNAFTISYKAEAEAASIITKAISREESSWYIALASLVSASIAGFTILKYNNRKLQIMLCNVNTIVISLVIGTYFIAIPKAKSMMLAVSDGSYEFAYFTPILCLILTQAAVFFIKKDERLVKSVDRIR